MRNQPDARFMPCTATTRRFAMETTMVTRRADRAETQFIDGPGARFAYRRLGQRSGVPLLMAMRFRGTIDHRDPALLDDLSLERDVIIFDNRGTGRSSGIPPATVGGLANGLLEFVDALGLRQVDLLGWSMGGFVVQVATLLRPGFVRRLIVAGSGPGGVPGMPASPDNIWQIMRKPVNDDEDFLALFYPETDDARRSGLASLRRLDTRLTVSRAAVAPEAVRAQLAAIAAFSGTGIWDRLGEFTLPVLVANGARDVIAHPFARYAMSLRLPDAKIILYSDAGH